MFRFPRASTRFSHSAQASGQDGGSAELIGFGKFLDVKILAKAEQTDLETLRLPESKADFSR